MPTYKQGQAPWETQQPETFQAGSAPWEQMASAQNTATMKPDPLASVHIGGTIDTNPIGNAGMFKGIVDTESTNLANMLYTNLMQKTGAPLTTLKQNIGAGAQLGSLVAAPGAAELSLPAAAGVGALQGGANAGGQAAAENQPAQEIFKRGGIGALLGAGTNAAVNAVGKLVGGLGDKITSSAIKPSQADIKDGFDVSTIHKYNLGGSLSTMYDKTEAKLHSLTTELNSKLSAGDVVNLNDVYQQTAKDLVTNSAKTFGSNTSINGALAQLQGEVTNITPDGQLTIPQAQFAKQAAGRMGAWFHGAPDPDANARQAVYNAFYRNLKTAIEDNSPPGVKDINKQISELIPVANAIVRRIPIAERNNALSLQDMLTLTAGVFNPHALVGFGISLAQKEGAVGNLLANLAPHLTKSANGLPQGASSLLNAVLPPSTTPPQSPEPVSQAQSTSPQASTDAFKNKFGMTKDEWIAKYGKFVEGSMGAGSVEKVGVDAAGMATHALKDAVISALEQGPKSLPGHLNDTVAKEIPGLIDSLKNAKGANTQAVNHALEVLRLLGHDTGSLVSGYMEQAGTQLKQLHDALGRFTGKSTPK